MTEQLVLEQRLVDALERRAARRVTEAAEEFYSAAKAYGLNVTEAQQLLHAPLSLRVDAWLERTRRLLAGGTYLRPAGPPAHRFTDR